MKEDESLDPIVRRIDAIIRLLLVNQRVADETMTTGDQLLILQDAGLSPSEAGRILGIASTQLSKYLKVAKNQQLKRKLEQKRGKGRT
jgi:hypothetical protein